MWFTIFFLALFSCRMCSVLKTIFIKFTSRCWKYCSILSHFGISRFFPLCLKWIPLLSLEIYEINNWFRPFEKKSWDRSFANCLKFVFFNWVRSLCSIEMKLIAMNIWQYIQKKSNYMSSSYTRTHIHIHLYFRVFHLYGECHKKHCMFSKKISVTTLYANQGPTIWLHWCRLRLMLYCQITWSFKRNIETKRNEEKRWKEDGR